MSGTQSQSDQSSIEARRRLSQSETTLAHGMRAEDGVSNIEVAARKLAASVEFGLSLSDTCTLTAGGRDALLTVTRPASVWEDLRASLDALRGVLEDYRCEYCGGPSDLPQVCAKCGEAG